MSSVPNTIKIDNVEYVRKDSVAPPSKPGKRAVVVFDRGWIFAGDVERKKNEVGQDRIYLSRVVHVRRWDSVGFDGMVADPNNKNVKPYLKPMKDIDLPKEAELFSVPVEDNWGM